MAAIYKPRPDRFGMRVSLRALFVLLTIVCVWLGTRVNWIHERHSASRVGESWNFAERPRAPGGLWILGEKGALYVSVYIVRDDLDDFRRPATNEPEIHLARRLFPEAAISAERWVSDDLAAMRKAPGGQHLPPKDVVLVVH